MTGSRHEATTFSLTQLSLHSHSQTLLDRIFALPSTIFEALVCAHACMFTLAT